MFLAKTFLYVLLKEKNTYILDGLRVSTFSFLGGTIPLRY